MRCSSGAFRLHSPSNRAGWPAQNQSTIIAPVESGSLVSCVWKKRFDGDRAYRISIAHLVARKLAPAFRKDAIPPFPPHSLSPLVASSLLRPDRKLINRKAAIAPSSINRSWLDPKIRNSIFICHGLLKNL